MWRGAILSPIPSEGGLQPIACCQPARSSEDGFFWLCRQVVFLAVSPGYFSGCVARLFFWLCRQVVFLAVSPGCSLAVSPGLLLTVSSAGFWGGLLLTFSSSSISRSRPSDFTGNKIIFTFTYCTHHVRFR